MDHEVLQVEDIDLSADSITVDELPPATSGFNCSATISTVASWFCGTLSSGSSYSTAGS